MHAQVREFAHSSQHKHTQGLPSRVLCGRGRVIGLGICSGVGGGCLGPTQFVHMQMHALGAHVIYVQTACPGLGNGSGTRKVYARTSYSTSQSACQDTCMQTACLGHGRTRHCCRQDAWQDQAMAGPQALPQTSVWIEVQLALAQA